MKFIDQFKRDLREFIRTTGIKPYKLAEMAGIHHTTIYSFLNGARPGMSMESYAKIKQAMSDYIVKDEVWTPDQKEVTYGETESTIGR